MTEEIVVFKGSRDGLHLIINKEKEVKVIQEKIQEKIASAQSFFQEIKKVKIKETSLSQDDLIYLTNWLKKSYEIEIDNEKNEDYKQINKDYISQSIEEGITKYIYTTIRSGCSIKYNGNVVIVGDVNPGAEVIATGNIIVMGTLRGIAHAGVLGNESALVVAFSLEPTQLRISNIIARSPDHQDYKPTCPEKACINGDTIIILPYYQNI